AHDAGEETGDGTPRAERLPPADPAGPGAGERAVAGIARSALFDQREGGDEVTARQGGEQTLPLLGAAAGGEQRRDDDRAGDEGAGQARVAHLLDEQDDVEQRAAGAAERRIGQQPRPAALG